MRPATAVVGEGKTLPAKRFWPHDLVLGLLPLLFGFQILVAIVFVPIALRGLADFRGLYADRKSTRLNSSHVEISYAVFCLKKKKKKKCKKVKTKKKNKK